uniref:Uncharacterized protein n=1 Tax=Anopheles maculatus TaxID=74869 RepID=A0A182TCJ2_9DIPT
MEIHDSVYYTCPYCDRGPLKAKASLRKHLYNSHADRAPPKEQMNKFITTLVEDMLTFKTIFPTEDGSIGESSMIDEQIDQMVLENCDQSSTCSSSNNTTATNVQMPVQNHDTEKKRKAGTDGRELHRQQEQQQQHMLTQRTTMAVSA